MTIQTRWTRLLAACGGGFASRLWGKRDDEKQAHKADLREWENEGGNLAPAPEVSKPVHTTSSA
jgi:hypothetical protein